MTDKPSEPDGKPKFGRFLKPSEPDPKGTGRVEIVPITHAQGRAMAASRRRPRVDPAKPEDETDA